jgi:hypothetical protein
MSTYTRLTLEASLVALAEAIVRARGEGTEPRTTKYDRPWTKLKISRGHWYRQLREGAAHDPRYAPRVARRFLPRRPATARKRSSNSNFRWRCPPGSAFF